MSNGLLLLRMPNMYLPIVVIQLWGKTNDSKRCFGMRPSVVPVQGILFADECFFDVNRLNW